MQRFVGTFSIIAILFLFETFSSAMNLDHSPSQANSLFARDCLQWGAQDADIKTKKKVSKALEALAQEDNNQETADRGQFHNKVIEVPVKRLKPSALADKLSYFFAGGLASSNGIWIAKGMPTYISFHEAAHWHLQHASSNKSSLLREHEADIAAIKTLNRLGKAHSAAYFYLCFYSASWFDYEHLFKWALDRNNKDEYPTATQRARYMKDILDTLEPQPQSPSSALCKSKLHWYSFLAACAFNVYCATVPITKPIKKYKSKTDRVVAKGARGYLLLNGLWSGAALLSSADEYVKLKKKKLL